jgi:hypothetical protein
MKEESPLFAEQRGAGGEFMRIRINEMKLKL